MKRRVIALTLALVVSCTGLYGCGSSKDTPKTPSAKSNGTVGDDEYTIRFWRSSDATDDWYKQKVEEFNQEHKGQYQVEMEIVSSSGTFSYDDKVSAAVTSKSLPDILMVDGPYVSTYAENGLIVSLEDYISESDKKDLMPGTLQQNSYNGELYAYSMTESSVALYYNKDMMEKAGLNVRIPETPQDAWTWEEYREIAKTLTGDSAVGTNIIMDKGEGMIYGLLPFFVSAGTGLISEDGTVAAGYFNNEAAADACEFLNSLIADGYANADPVDNEFANQLAGTMISGSYQLANADSWDFEWGVTYYPIAKEGAESASPNGDWVFTLTSMSQNPEAAAEFLNFICDAENCRENASVNAKIPARISVMDAVEEWAQYPNSVFREQLTETSYARPTTPVYATLTSEFSASLFDIFSGADIQETLDAAAETIDTEYQDNYAQ